MHLEQDFIYDEMLNKINMMHNILIDIKDGTDNIEKVNELFRAVHTIKGAADLLFLMDIVDITHKSEDLLIEVRDGKISLDSILVRLFVEIKDFLSLMLNNTYHNTGDDETINSLSQYFDKKIESFKLKHILLISEFDLKGTFDDEDQDGCSILSTTKIDQGRSILKNSNIDLLFIDIEDDDEQGISLIDDLKENPDYKYLPIVLLISKNYPNLKYIGQLTGAKAWLEKPVSKDKVSMVIKKVLG